MVLLRAILTDNSCSKKTILMRQGWLPGCIFRKGNSVLAPLCFFTPPRVQRSCLSQTWCLLTALGFQLSLECYSRLMGTISVCQTQRKHGCSLVVTSRNYSWQAKQLIHSTPEECLSINHRLLCLLATIMWSTKIAMLVINSTMETWIMVENIIAKLICFWFWAMFPTTNINTF